MNKRIAFLKRYVLGAVAVCLFSSLGVFAAVSERNQTLVAQNLSQKLRTDLGDHVVRVKLNSVEEYKVSKNEIGYKGDAVAILTDASNQLAFRFEAEVNQANESVSDIRYDFIESASPYAPTSNEEFLMKELMTQIKRDYKTENIVIAIDRVEAVESAAREKKFLGFGEVRIGGMIWNRIKFDVVLDADTQKANKIVYRVEK